MTELVVILLAIGVVFLFLEMFIPDFGFFGIVGLLSLVASGILAVIYIENGWFIVLGEVLLVLAVVLFFVFYMRKKRLSGHLIMNDALKEDTPFFENLDAYIGREGVAATVLRPFGKVDFDGTLMEATSNGPYFDIGDKVCVIEVYESKLKVKKI